MSHLPSLIVDLAIILIAAGFITILFKYLKQPVVLGYIVAGFVVGPHFQLFPTITDTVNIQTWADIGVIFLLFALGLDFSFKKLMNVGGAASITAITILLSMSFLGYLTGKLLGWSHMNSLFLGGMLSMSSTTIIIKTFDDLGLRNKQFTKLVFGILVVEDLFAIVMMVLLSTIAVKNHFEKIELLQSVLKLIFFLLCWFLVGIYLIPTFFKKIRQQMNDETLIVLSLGLCLGMVLLATKAGFSSALGAFVMGSILAETIEGEKIEKVVKPVKDFFGAIFFVSVGGMIDPAALLEYWFPILLITLVVVVGQITSAIIGVLLSGQSLRVAVQTGFCLSQIGEFAFILAGLGLSLNVTDSFLYPIVVAVSVITTFWTPYIIKTSNTAYDFIERHLPHKWFTLWFNNVESTPTVVQNGIWNSLLKQIFRIVVIYSVLTTAVILISFSYLIPMITHLVEGIGGRLLAAIVVLTLMSPFLRAIMVKKNHSKEVRFLWNQRRFNRGPLISIVVFRIVLCLLFVTVVLSHLFDITYMVLCSMAAFILGMMFLSRRLKKESIMIERHFKKNLNERAVYMQQRTPFGSHFVDNLLSRDLHISEFEVKQDSASVGQSLKELDFRRKCNVNIIAIQRGNHFIHIPGGNEVIYPFDKITVLGTDETLALFTDYIEERNKQYLEGEETVRHDLDLSRLQIDIHSALVGKTVSESRIREEYACMIVGIERGMKNMMNPAGDQAFAAGDILWVAGEKKKITELGRLTGG